MEVFGDLCTFYLTGMIMIFSSREVESESHEDMVCDMGYFLSINNRSGVLTFSCSECTVCPPGEGATQDCSETSNTVCNRCGAGTFSLSEYEERACVECSDCSKQHREEVRKCNITHDTLCGSCINGYIEDNLYGCKPGVGQGSVEHTILSAIALRVAGDQHRDQFDAENSSVLSDKQMTDAADQLPETLQTAPIQGKANFKLATIILGTLVAGTTFISVTVIIIIVSRKTGIRKCVTDDQLNKSLVSRLDRPDSCDTVQEVLEI